MELKKIIATTIRGYSNKQKQLNEASFHSFNNDDILNDKYIKNFINNDDVVDNLLDWYIQTYDLDEDDKENIRLSQDIL
jgi:hypothetical protein